MCTTMHDSEKEGIHPYIHSFIHFLFKGTKLNFRVYMKNVNASVNGMNLQSEIHFPRTGNQNETTSHMPISC